MSLVSSESRRRKLSAVGSQLPINRCATAASSAPPARASARTTRLWETPTRNAPVISLFQTKRSVSSRELPASRITTR